MTSDEGSAAVAELITRHSARTAKAKRKARAAWTVYILRCADGSLYTGITRDVERRVVELNSHALLAARYTRSRRPVVLVYREAAATRSAAARREYEIKQLGRGDKETLVARDQLKVGRRKSKGG